MILLFFIVQPQRVANRVTLQMYENINPIVLFSEKKHMLTETSENCLLRLQKTAYGSIESLWVFVGDEMVAFD